MAEVLEREIRFDIAPALSSLQDLDSAFEQLFARVEAGLASAVQSGIDQGLAGETAEVDVSANVDEAQGDIAGLEGGEVDVPVVAETEEASADVDAFVGEAEANEVSIPVTVETGDAETQLDSLSGSASGTTDSFSALDAATAGATQKLIGAGAGAEGAAGGLAAVSAGTIGATAGVGAVVVGLGALVKTGADVLEVTQQFDNTFGRFGARVKQIDVAGLNTSLEELSLSLGTDDEALLAATSKAGAFAQTLGLSQQQAADFAERVVALGAEVSSVNPALGDIDTVVGRISQTLARSPGGLGRLGLDVDPARIEQLANSIGKTTDELTKGEKASFAAQAALEGVGDVSDDVARRQGNAGVIIRSTVERFQDLIEEVAVPVAVPVLNAIQDFAPILQSLIPVARIFGEVIGFALRAAIAQLASFASIIGSVVAGIGDFINSANDIPFVGKLIGDDLGGKVKDFGVGLEEASQQALEAARNTKGMASAGDELSQSTEQAEGGLQGMATAEEIAGRAAEESQKQVEAFVSSATGALPQLADALSAFNSGIDEATSGIASAQDAAKSANEKAAQDVADARKGVVDAQAQAADDLAKGQRDAAEKIAKAQADGDEKIRLAANVSSEALAEARKQAAEGLKKAQDAAADASASQAEAAAQRVADAQGKVAEANAAVVSTAAEGEKEIADAQDRLAQAADPQRFIDNLAQQTLAIASFQGNLQKLLDAGLTNLAEFIATQGPEAGAALAQSFVNDPELAKTAERTVAGFKTVSDDAAAFLTNVAAPQIQSAAAGVFRFDIVQVRKDGMSIGEEFAAGIAAGLTSEQASKAVENSSRLAVRNAKEASLSEGRIGSPSKLFRDEVGIPLVEGIEAGLRDRVALAGVAAASEAAVQTAVPVLSPAALAPVPGAPALVGAGVGASGGPGGQTVGGPGVTVMGPLVEAHTDADPLHISTEIAWELQR